MKAEQTFNLGFVFDIQAKPTLLLLQIRKIKAKRILFIPQIRKIEAERTLFIPQIGKIEAKRSLFIPQIRKIEAEQIRLIPEIGKIKAKKMNWIKVKRTEAVFLKLLWSPGIDSKELIPPAYALAGLYNSPIPASILSTRLFCRRQHFVDTSILSTPTFC
jgi:hypothetical protein